MLFNYLLALMDTGTPPLGPEGLLFDTLPAPSSGHLRVAGAALEMANREIHGQGQDRRGRAREEVPPKLLGGLTNIIISVASPCHKLDNESQSGRSRPSQVSKQICLPPAVVAAVFNSRPSAGCMIVHLVEDRPQIHKEAQDIGNRLARMHRHMANT